MSSPVSGVGNYGTKGVLGWLWNKVEEAFTDTAEDTSSVAVPAAASGCNGGGFPNDIDAINITPDASGDGISVEDGTIVFTGDYLIDDLGARVQESGDIALAPVSFTFSGASSRVIRIVVESVPEGLNPDLVGLDGMIDVTPVEADAPNAFNLGTTEAPSYIVDPFDPNNRLPVFVGAYTIKDLTGRIADINDEVCSAEDIYLDSCAEGPIGATPHGTSIVVPPAAYADNEGDFQVSFTLRVDPSQKIPGHGYDYRLRIMLALGPASSEADADAGEESNAGEVGEDGIDADVPADIELDGEVTE